MSKNRPVPKRMTANVEGDFVVFLIGMRINSLWRIHKWLPTALAMPRMMKELTQQPELGLLGAHSWFGRTTIMLQYWRSLDHLMSYAHAKDAEHLPAWQAFNKRVRGSTAVGIWHETYQVRDGLAESFYRNMPSFGLARATELIDWVGQWPSKDTPQAAAQ